jgi:hypothetical protein
MRNLLWKEWHEQSWKLAFGCIVLGALALIGLRARIVADETMMMWVCALGLALLPVLSSTGLIPAERAEGSFESLLAMPIAPWRILLAKTFMGLLLCVGPLIFAAVVSLLIAGGREMYSSSVVDLYGRSILVTISLFVWMLALTARLPSEARAALVAMGIFVCWILATEGLAVPGVPQVLLAASPLVFLRSWFSAPDAGLPTFIAPCLQLLIAAALWAMTARSLKVLTARES